MLFGTGPKFVPFLVLTNLWTLALLFFRWNHHARYEVAQTVKNLDDWLGISPEGTESSEMGAHLVPIHHKPKPVEVDKAEEATVLVVPQPVVPARDPNLPAFCPVCGEGDPICAKYGLVFLSSRCDCLVLTFLPLSSKFTIARSVAYGGPSARLLRVLKSAREGKPIKIGVIGGSVSSGHGVTYDQNWHTIFAKWWKAVR